MKCFECGTNYPAISYERKVGNAIEVEHYCLSCYQRKFLSVELDGSQDGKHYDSCPYCGMSAETLKKTAIVGCAHCYRALGDVVIPMTVRMQQGSADVHCGKLSESASPKAYYENRLKELKTLADYYKNMGDRQSLERMNTEWQRITRLLERGEGYEKPSTDF